MFIEFSGPSFSQGTQMMKAVVDNHLQHFY